MFSSSTAQIIDLGGVWMTPISTKVLQRLHHQRRHPFSVLLNGCQDTDNNASDFTAGAPAPRNTASTFNVCSTVEDAPTVTSTVPADGASEVARNSDITVNFSEPVNVTDPWFSLSCCQQRRTHCSGLRRSFQLHVESRYRFCLWRNLHARHLRQPRSPTRTPSTRPITWHADFSDYIYRHWQTPACCRIPPSLPSRAAAQRSPLPDPQPPRVWWSAITKALPQRCAASSFRTPLVMATQPHQTASSSSKAAMPIRSAWATWCA